MKKLLEGKTAIITGASKGIGKAVAELFIEEGAAIVITARGEAVLHNTVAELKAKGGRVIGLKSDAGSLEDCNTVFETAIREFGQVDIVVNNAGIAEMKMIEEVSDELWREVQAINIDSVFYYSRAAVRHMLPRNSGSIINVSSVNGIRPVCGAAYCASKGAVNALTKNIAYRLNHTNIRCNAVCPGKTETDMASAVLEGPLAGGMTPICVAMSDLEVGTMPMDQAKAVLFFASDLSTGVNGVSLPVEKGGGYY
jgi:3-oxoacyl-[acyl-carrier protein] reductase